MAGNSFTELQVALATSDILNIAAALDISVRTNAECPDYAHLDYGIASPRDNALVLQCRGTTVDLATREIVAPGLLRFFNLEESQAAPIDWDSAIAYEKLDGSFIKLWWSEKYDKWIASTRGSLCASGTVHTGDTTFSELFFATLPVSTDCLNSDIIYYFELCTAKNRVVVQYESDFVRLIAARARKELFEYDVSYIATLYGLPRVEEFEPGDWPSFVRETKGLKGCTTEGIIVCDKFFNRVKVKTEDYVMRHYHYSNDNPYKLWLLPDGDAAEVCSYFPDRKTALDDIEKAIELLSAEVASIVDWDYKTIGTAPLPKSTKSAAFALKRGHAATVRDWAKALQPKSLEAVVAETIHILQ